MAYTGQRVAPQKITRPSTVGGMARAPAIAETPAEVPDGAIPKRYLSLAGATTEAAPTPITRLRLFLHGGVGQGKTTFLLSWPRTIVFDFENKARSIPDRAPGVLVVHRKTGEEYDEVIQMLIDDGLNDCRAFDFVAFDPIASYIQLERISLTNTYRQEGLFDGPGDITSYGKHGLGWDTVNNKIIGQLVALYNSGYGWLVTAHMAQTWKRVGDRDVSVWESAINPGVLRFLYKDAEFTGSLERHVKMIAPIEQKAVGGRIIHVESKAKAVPQYTWLLNLLPYDEKLPIRQHVPMGEDPILVPSGQGYASFAGRYEAAIAKLYS